jgi:hypothetical protein
VRKHETRPDQIGRQKTDKKIMDAEREEFCINEYGWAKSNKDKL